MYVRYPDRHYPDISGHFRYQDTISDSQITDFSYLSNHLCDPDLCDPDHSDLDHSDLDLMIRTSVILTTVIHTSVILTSMIHTSVIQTSGIHATVIQTPVIWISAIRMSSVSKRAFCPMQRRLNDVVLYQ